MPLFSSVYKAPTWIGGKHAQTILPALLRKVTGVQFQRERISTEDGDFLDIDWSTIGSNRLAIFSHGLEGSSRQPYILGMTKEFNARGWDCLGWNFRSCSGVPNQTIRLYHAGAIEDLKCVVDHAIATKRYKKVCLLGFSLGGSITLKYLGDLNSDLPKQIYRACVFSVPCDLYACARSLSHGLNRFYLNRFLVTLKAKVAEKAKLYPGIFSSIDVENIDDFIDFDNKITAPLCGFRDALHYYIECSSKHSIPKIQIPTLIVNAQNDPFLHPSCFPKQACHKSSIVCFESPYDGGHQGFVKDNISGTYWSEERGLRFIELGK